jgi:hypothetical protein
VIGCERTERSANKLSIRSAAFTFFVTGFLSVVTEDYATDDVARSAMPLTNQPRCRVCR